MATVTPTSCAPAASRWIAFGGAASAVVEVIVMAKAKTAIQVRIRFFLRLRFTALEVAAKRSHLIGPTSPNFAISRKDKLRYHALAPACFSSRITSSR